MNQTSIKGFFLLVFFFSSCSFVIGQDKKMPLYTRDEAMVPMRDGTLLHTVIYQPEGLQELLPFLLTRTPYGADDIIEPAKNDYVKAMAKSGYIFVYQDIRGRYKSGGTYMMMKPLAPDSSKGADESTDAFDTIDWLLKNIKGNNGKVGIYGISYAGWTSVMAAIRPHPALVAVSEQASPADMWIGDDLHHNGAFRLSYGLEYVFSEEASSVDSLFPFPVYDTYDWYLKLGPLSNVNDKYFHHRMPTWDAFIRHPDYDSFWRNRAVPVQQMGGGVHYLHVAGWWDQEDFFGPLRIYSEIEKKGKAKDNMIVIGPWNHGEWAYWPGNRLGNISFGENTSDKFRDSVQAPWFAYWLKGQGEGNFPKALVFQTGSDKWESYSKWPVEGADPRKLYLHAGGKLSFNEPVEKNEDRFDSYISDPAHPVPYRPRPVEETYADGSRWGQWLTEDQRFVKDRPDVLSWESDELSKDLAVTGEISAGIYAATTGSDADWVVKLIDVYPEQFGPEPKMSGYELMVANEVFRGRYRESFEKPSPVVPGRIGFYRISLHEVDHLFKKGHRIMVQVQSSWFPLIDRNPQTFVPNIFLAKAKDYRKAVQRIYGSASHASYICLPVAR